MLKQELIKELNKKHLPLAKEIREKNGLNGSSDQAYSFIITGLKILYPRITDNQLKKSITDDHRDGGFDVIHFSKSQQIISIFDFKDTGNFNYQEIKSFKDNIKLYLFTRENLDDLATNAKKHLETARRYIRNGWRVNIYVARNSVEIAPKKVRLILEKLKNSFPSITVYDFINVDSIVKKCANIKLEDNNHKWKIQVVSGKNEEDSLADKIIIKERSNGPIKSMFARLKLVDILSLQKHFIDNNLNLFEANVREFQKNKKISEKLIGSIDNYPDTFYIFHNGLTFICKNIDKLSEHNFIIQAPQIINGCQTVSSIYDSYKNNSTNKKLKQATILCRFYALKSNLVEKVCESTNTQLKINLWDLRANDEIQKILEQALAIKDIAYRRKKSGKNQEEIFITDLAQWIYSCLYDKPAEAKNKKAELFGIISDNSPYYKIFSEKRSLEEILQIIKIAFFIKEKINKIKKSKRTFEKDADFHFIAALYHLEKKHKNWVLNYRYKRVHRIIKNTIEDLKQKHGQDLSLNKIFTKKEETWNQIKKKIYSL